MILPVRSSIVALCLALAAIGAAQDGVSTAGAARSRYLGNLGIIPASREVAVEDFINYHRHEIPRPRAGQAVALDLRWGGQSVSKGEDAILQIGMSTALSHDKAHLRPINLALVIDKSGSMADANKLDRVKDALLTLIPKLRPTDTLSIIAFDTTAEVILPAEPVGDGSKAKDVIDGLEPGSSTNLNGGLMLGYQEDLKNFRKDATNRVILLTDGIANQGVTNPYQISKNSLGYNDKGIDLSTIGVGQDLNKDLLQDLAKSGRGLYHFVADSQDIQKVFENEVQSLLSPVAGEPNLTIEPGPGFRLDKIYGYDPKTSDGSTRIKLDNMNSGMTEVVLLKVRPSGEDTKLLIKVRLSYYDIDKGEQVTQTQSTSVDVDKEGRAQALQDDSVAKNYTIANLAQAIHDMAKDCEGKNYVKGQQVLDAAISDAKERYPSGEDVDVNRVLATAEQYRTILRNENGDNPIGANLIPNGDFSMGNWGFASDLQYFAPTTNCLWPQGYTVAFTFDHPQLHEMILSQDFAAPKKPDGNEQVLFANANGTQKMTLWSTQVKCKPHTRYRISFQSISLTPGSEWIPIYQIRANGFTSSNQSSREGSYNAIATDWDSGDEASAIISIVRLPSQHTVGIIGIADIEMIEIPG